MQSGCSSGAEDDTSGLYVYTAAGNTVYGTTAVDNGVISDDGGRSWGEPFVQPGGPGDLLAVVDGGLLAIETIIFGPCAGVVWASADGADWQRVLNPWPSPGMNQPVVNADTILIPSSRCTEGGEPVDWIGTIR